MLIVMNETCVINAAGVVIQGVWIPHQNVFIREDVADFAQDCFVKLENRLRPVFIVPVAKKEKFTLYFVI